MTGIHLFALSIAQADVETAEDELARARRQRLVEIEAARDAGMSWGQIAAQLGVNQETPRMIAARADRLTRTTELAPRAANSGAVTQKEGDSL